MSIKIRQEEVRDYKILEKLVEKAFEKVEYSEYKEYILVKNLKLKVIIS